MSKKDKVKKPDKKEELNTKNDKKEKNKESDKKKIPEPVPTHSPAKKFAIAAFVLLLGVCLIFIIAKSSDTTNPPVTPPTVKSELVFVNPSSCGDLCAELAPIAKQYADKLGLGFRNVKYEQELTNIPGIYFLGATDMTTITAVTEKEHIITYFCQYTGDQNICGELDIQLDPVKSGKPTVELFVMSHCPYGLQMEKAMLPVVDLLGDKIDFDLKFVYYAMHGETEVNEQMLQYCIQKEQPRVLTEYLECFVDSGNGPECFNSIEMNRTPVKDCFDGLNTEFGVLDDLADESTYVSGRFPKFVLDEEDNVKYNVKGSPTLIINGKQSDAARNSDSLLKAICETFEIMPEECSNNLESRTPSAGFGLGDFGASNDASCG